MPVTDSIFDYIRKVCLLKKLTENIFIIIIITINDGYSSIKNIFIVDGVL